MDIIDARNTFTLKTITDRHGIEIARATVEVLELARVDAAYAAWLRVTLEALPFQRTLSG